jgi:Na+/phosphate symporter
MVASAVISFATSLKLPLSTTYVTFMVSMGTSLSDRAWGRESAVYRITGVLTVIGGWFFTAFVAFSCALLFASLIYFFKILAVIGLLVLVLILILHSYRLHFRKEKETSQIEAFSLKNVHDAETAIRTSFEQTGHFLKSISDTLTVCFEAAFSGDRQQLKNLKTETVRIETWANVIIANIFKTLFLLNKEDVENSHRYAHTIRALQDLVESFRDIVLRTAEHFENYHTGFTESQKEELRKIKTYTTRLLWNTSIMLLQRKKVDYDYIASQNRRLNDLAVEFDKNQINRIQQAESKTRLSILFYSLIEDCIKLSREMDNLLKIFKDTFEIGRKT